MGRVMSFVVFITVVLLVVSGLHLYFWSRLIRNPAWPAPWSRIALYLMLALAVSLPVTFALSRVLSHSTARFVLFPAYLWMGMALLIFTVLAATDVLRLILWGVDRVFLDRAIWKDAARVLLLARIQAGVALGTALILTGLAIPNALALPRVVRVEVPIKHLSPSLDGLRIAQLTDTHLGWILHRDWLSKVVDKTMALNPHLVVVTGDLADGSPEQLGPAVEPLKRLRPPLGTFFSTGNHEFYAGWPSWKETLQKLGLIVLDNRRMRLSHEGADFELAGITDFDALRVAPQFGPDLDGALEGRDPKLPLILLSHQVRIWDAASARDVDLVISGHNHGGQFWPWGYFVYIQQPILSGLHRQGKTWAYVSDGTGFWGPPMRLGTHGEITLITLRSVE